MGNVWIIDALISFSIGQLNTMLIHKLCNVWL